MTRRVGLTIALAAGLFAFPSLGYAQSAITGVVKDTSGAVLPGVTVEASSEALIEKSRSVVTDGSGVYRIVDLRPGLYAVTFTLAGFQTFRREGLQLPGDFTATVNVDMQVGALEETITVAGSSPIVDVQNAAHVQVLDREALDSIPTGRTIQGIGQMIVGINLSLPDVGGSRGAMQTYMSVHGQSAASNTVMVDGMPVNGLEANGAVQGYFNDAMAQEMTYQTSGIGAETSGGGVRLNMIPREGGNRFSGDTQIAYRPGEWQGDNFTPRLAATGLASGNSTELIFDWTISQGGPIKRDRLWFFASGRDFETDNRIPGTFFDDGSPGVDANHIRQALGRLTLQLTTRTKLSGYYDRVDKYRSHDMQSNYDPETASRVWTSPNYSTGAIKTTHTVTNRLLLDGGYSFNYNFRDVGYQEGIFAERGTPEWYRNTLRTQQGVTLGARKGAGSSHGKDYPERHNVQAAMSFVTGSHNFKVGFSHQWGKFYHEELVNGDLWQRYEDAALTVPFDVLVRNTPVASQEQLNYDFGIYAQDSWTLKRLTLNAGLRWETIKAQVDSITVSSGRFVPARTAEEHQDLPLWKDWAPRFQAVYDVFGNAKTAVKYSVNRYNAAAAVSLAATFNPLTLTSSTASTNFIPWTDLNGDDVAQGERTWNADGTSYTDCVYLTPGCEINLSRLRSNFGLLTDAGEYGGYPRTWNLEHGLELQHELLPRLSVTGTWFHGDRHDLTSTVNRALTHADYTEIQIYNPIDGTPITLYNLTPSAASRASNSVTFVDPDHKEAYNSYSAEFRWRPGRGGILFGGISFERELERDCTTAEDDPNQLRFCDEFQNGLPFARHFRLNGSYPLPWGFIVSGAFQSNDGGARSINYAVARTTRYPNGSATYLAAGAPVPACPAPCPAGDLVVGTRLTQTSVTIPLVADGINRNERLNQLDLKIARTFNFGRVRVTPAFEAFNVNNTDNVITYASSNYATAGGAYLRPNSIVQGRILGVGANVRW